MTTSSDPRLLTQGSLARHMLRLSWPMVLAIASAMLFNLADTYFLARLGPAPLAAISLVFPVAMTLFSICIGLGIGLTSRLARATGANDRTAMQQLTTDGLSLSVILVGLVSALGLATIDPLFTRLGATPEVMPFIRDYMEIWYLGMVFMVVPMIGNAALRAIGDARVPGLIMLVSTVLNAIFDPLLIFGIGPVPRLEMQGAALASVLARALTLIIALWYLSHRDRLLIIRRRPWRQILTNWSEILHIGGPAALSQIVVPISAAIINTLIVAHGTMIVGGFGIANRIEALALIPLFALSGSIGPVIGQNLGAAAFDRVRRTLSLSFSFSIIWGLAAAAILALGADSLPALFSQDPRVQQAARLYLILIPLSYAGSGLHFMAVAAFNGLGRPRPALFLTLLRIFGLLLPIAFIGDELGGYPGILLAFAASNLVSGGVAAVMSLRACQPTRLAPAGRLPAT